MTMDRTLLAERTAVVERHLRRVHEKLPTDPGELKPMTDASDAVILHLYQAVQIVIDLAVSACVRLGLGAPATYAEAFRKLATAGYLDDAIAERLARSAGFRNVIAHAYEQLDLARVHRAATEGAGDLRAFLAKMRDVAE